MRKHVDDFTVRVGSSSNILIATLRENSFTILVLSDRNGFGVYILFIIRVVIICLYSTLFLCIFVLYYMGQWA